MPSSPLSHLELGKNEIDSHWVKSQNKGKQPKEEIKKLHTFIIPVCFLELGNFLLFLLILSYLRLTPGKFLIFKEQTVINTGSTRDMPLIFIEVHLTDELYTPVSSSKALALVCRKWFQLLIYIHKTPISVILDKLYNSCWLLFITSKMETNGIQVRKVVENI